MGENKHDSIKDVEERSQVGAKPATWVPGASGFTVGTNMLVCS